MEPTIKCPNCDSNSYAEYVDIGFGPYSQQAGPYICSGCGWVEQGCPLDTCIENKCISYQECDGRAINESRLKSLVLSLLSLLDKEEVSDNNKTFRPNNIVSCRVFDTNRINNILSNIKKEVGQ